MSKTEVKTLDWYVKPKEQIDTVREFLWENGNIWGFSRDDIPPIPTGFKPRTPREVLMLAVYLPDKDGVLGFQRTIDEWWKSLVPPEGYDKWLWEGMDTGPDWLRPSQDFEYLYGIRWVAFNPIAHVGMSVRSLWENPDSVSRLLPIRLAGPEVAMAARHFPGWVSSWEGVNWPSPNMAGYKSHYGANPDAGTPYLCRDDENKLLKMGVFWSSDKSIGWASPTVREL